MIIHCPAVECVPVNGFERGTEELQRFRSGRRYFDQLKRARRKLGPRPLRAVTRLGWQAEQRRDHGCGHNCMSQMAMQGAVHDAVTLYSSRRKYTGGQGEMQLRRRRAQKSITASHCFDPNPNRDGVWASMLYFSIPDLEEVDPRTQTNS